MNTAIKDIKSGITVGKRFHDKEDTADKPVGSGNQKENRKSHSVHRSIALRGERRLGHETVQKHRKTLEGFEVYVHLKENKC